MNCNCENKLTKNHLSSCPNNLINKYLVSKYVGGRFSFNKKGNVLAYYEFKDNQITKYDMQSAYPWCLNHKEEKMSMKQRWYEFKHTMTIRRTFEASALHLTLITTGMVLWGMSYWDAYNGRYLAFGVGLILSSIPIILGLKNIKRIE